uniref:NADH-ubiquinone oxidoreductase chain 4 n=1 Tax=Chudania hellerina TaxID=2840403 RepID=A0A8E8L8R6_9HEMI|nr:NADH dehydrogenase subunit 4 [Chudania hellerina]
MLKLLVYMIFMIPLLFFLKMWFLYQFMMIILIIFILMFYCNSYYSYISYFLGLDWVSYSLIILSLLISCLMILSSNKMKNSSSSFYLFVNFLLCTFLILVFSMLNMFMMYMFFEFSLIPLMLIIIGWGYQPERLISGLYLFFYTLFASLPLLLLIIYIYNEKNTLFFDLNFLSSMSFFFYFMMIFAFLVKLPMFMFHFWLPKAHVQAPVSGSMILAGVLLKIGGYGIIRFMFIYEYMFLNYSYIFYSLSILGSILVSMICLIQGDVKCLIAYSSVAHMGMCLMSLLTMTNWGVISCFLMMIGHGLCSSSLFCLSNMSYERLNSRVFFINKGMMTFMPSMTFFWFIMCSFNMSCPPSMNFISELMIMTSMINYWNLSFYYLFFISFLSACFSFYLFSFTQHGQFSNIYCYMSGYIREYLIIFTHVFPLIFFLMVMDCLL